MTRIAIGLLLATIPLLYLNCSRLDSLSGGIVDDNGQNSPTPAKCSVQKAMVTLPYASVAGVNADLLSVDLYGYQIPAEDCSRVPVVVYVHGGAWAIGDKANVGYKAALFNSLGYVFVSVNYRLSANPPSRPTGVQHPVHEQDVASAVRWVYDNIADHGGNNQRIGLLGHSAGAHLVALLGVHPTYSAAAGLLRSQFRCIASLDTEGLDIPTALLTAGTQQIALFDNAFGTSAAVYADASPITHVAPGSGIAPFFLVKRGLADRKAIVDDFHASLSAAAIPSTVIDATGLNHEEVNDAVGDPADVLITPALTSFFGDCL